MQAVLAGLEWSNCFVYLDDILIASRTFDEHLCHIREVLGRLCDAGLRLKLKKDVPFNWTPACDEVFCHLKDLPATAPVLAYPRFGDNKEFILETDVSAMSLGSVLCCLSDKTMTLSTQ